MENLETEHVQIQCPLDRLVASASAVRVGLWTEQSCLQRFRTCSVSRFSVGDSLESSRIRSAQFRRVGVGGASFKPATERVQALADISRSALYRFAMYKAISLHTSVLS